MSRAAPEPDPQPVPPRRPEPGECCRGGCSACVFDLYWQELARYELRLRAWQERHPAESLSR